MTAHTAATPDAAFAGLRYMSKALTKVASSGVVYIGLRVVNNGSPLSFNSHMDREGSCEGQLDHKRG